MPSDPRERRTVTVLFSDLSGFTTLSEQMDPEEVSVLIDALFQRFRAAVMAVFGARKRRAPLHGSASF